MPTPKIYTAIPKIMADIPAIGKENKNREQGYKFRGIDDIYNVVQPVMAKYGVFSTTEVLDDQSEEKTSKRGSILIYRILKVKYTFWADDGSSVSSVVTGEGMDTGDKASNKAMAVAHKYAIIQLLQIPTDDPVDPENDSHDVIRKKTTNDMTKAQVTEIRVLKANPLVNDEEKTNVDRWLTETHTKESADKTIGMLKGLIDTRSADRVVPTQDDDIIPF